MRESGVHRESQGQSHKTSYRKFVKKSHKTYQTGYRSWLVCGGVLFLLILVCAGGWMIPEEAVKGSFLEAKQPPSLRHWFGTDALGQDLFLRTMKGLGVSVTVGVAASLVSAGIAVLVGIATAAGNPTADRMIRWLIDLMMAVPHMIFILLISFVMGKGLPGLLAGIAATHWCSLSRVIRAEVLQLRSRPYILYSRKAGKSESWILRHHLLPHLLPQLLTGMVLMFPHAVLHEASVSFLGFGLPPEQPSIGMILSESMRYLSAGMWWPAVLPGLTLAAVVLLIDRLGSCMQEITGTGRGTRYRTKQDRQRPWEEA